MLCAQHAQRTSGFTLQHSYKRSASLSQSTPASYRSPWPTGGYEEQGAETQREPLDLVGIGTSPAVKLLLLSNLVKYMSGEIKDIFHIFTSTISHIPPLMYFTINFGEIHREKRIEASVVCLLGFSCSCPLAHQLSGKAMSVEVSIYTCPFVHVALPSRSTRAQLIELSVLRLSHNCRDSRSKGNTRRSLLHTT